jgi:hypothetical protein
MKNYLRKYAQMLKEFLLLKQEKEYLSIENNEALQWGLYANLDFEIYFIVDKFSSIPEINNFITQILKIVKNEENTYFIIKTT